MRKKCPRVRPAGVNHWYEGTLWPPKMGLLERKAYSVYRRMKQRCYNIKTDNYRYYGGKGIKVLLESREFIGWWVEQQGILKLKNPSVSRRDHSGDYYLWNMKLEEMFDNISEMAKRCKVGGKRPKKPVFVFNLNTSDEFVFFMSRDDAAKELNMKASSISEVCRGECKQCKGFTFRYAEEYDRIRHGRTG